MPIDIKGTIILPCNLFGRFEAQVINGNIDIISVSVFSEKGDFIPPNELTDLECTEYYNLIQNCIRNCINQGYKPPTLYITQV